VRLAEYRPLTPRLRSFLEVGDGCDRRERVKIDWNPVIHILDELSDGTHSFLEMSYMAHNYAPESFLDSLLFLADRELVELSTGRNPLGTIPGAECSQRLREAFGVDAAGPASMMMDTSIDLTEKGEQMLRLLNVGHPPLSGSGKGS
jgi:hypothetical protein